MDVDKSLDDLIGEKKGNEQPRRQPRQSGGRGNVPYARPPPRSTEEKWVHDAYSGPGAQRREPRGLANGASVAGTGVGFTGVSPRIEVVGLHYEVTPQDLKNIFSQAGTLVQGPTIRIRELGVRRDSVGFRLSIMIGQASNGEESCLCMGFRVALDVNALPFTYDRSGRSRGEATMEYASYQQAKSAINKFDGAMTKGQTISIRLLPPAQVRAAPGAVGSAARGGRGAAPGQSLMARLGAAPAAAPVVAQAGLRGGGRGGRGGPRGRGGAAGGGGRGGRRGPATEGDLDKELDSFMGGGAKPAEADVDMS